MGGNTICAQHDLLDLRGVGQHGNDHIALLANLLLGGCGGTAGRQFLHRGGGTVIDQQVRVACLQQVLCHRLAHNTQTDKSDFHIDYLALCVGGFSFLALVYGMPGPAAIGRVTENRAAF